MSQQDDAFASTFKTVMIVLIVIGLVIFGIAKMITGGFYKRDAASGSSVEQVVERVKPVATVKIASADAAGQQADAKPAAIDGKSVYQGACFACHGTGAAGAPKVGDKANWGPRIAQGGDKLKDHALNGFQGSAGVMPPKGGRTDLSDAEVIAAMEYMVAESK